MGGVGVGVVAVVVAVCFVGVDQEAITIYLIVGSW